MGRKGHWGIGKEEEDEEEEEGKGMEEGEGEGEGKGVEEGEGVSSTCMLGYYTVHGMFIFTCM